MGMFAVEYMIKSWLTYRYKCCFDEALLLRKYDKVSHDVFYLTHASPSLAVVLALRGPTMYVETTIGFASLLTSYR